MRIHFFLLIRGSRSGPNIFRRKEKACRKIKKSGIDFSTRQREQDVKKVKRQARGVLGCERGGRRAPIRRSTRRNFANLLLGGGKNTRAA